MGGRGTAAILLTPLSAPFRRSCLIYSAQLASN